MHELNHISPLAAPSRKKKGEKKKLKTPDISFSIMLNLWYDYGNEYIICIDKGKETKERRGPTTPYHIK